MKAIEIKTTLKINPIDYAKNALEILDGQHIGEVILPKYDSKERENTAGNVLFNAKVRNTDNPAKLINFLQCAIYMHKAGENETKLATLQEDFAKVSFEKDSAKFAEMQAREEQKNEFFDVILAHEIFTDEMKAFLKNDIFANMYAGTFTGDFTVVDTAKTADGKYLVDFAGLLDLLKKYTTSNATKAQIKSKLQEICNALSNKSTACDLYNGYHYNCNAGLVEDVIARYYKGRAWAKNGQNIKKNFDEKLKLVKKEIALAIIEDLLTKQEKREEQQAEPAPTPTPATEPKQEEPKAGTEPAPTPKGKKSK